VRNEVEHANRRAEAWNQRIFFVLKRTTGEEREASSAAWWQWWIDYNELYVPDQKPVYRIGYQHREYLFRMSSCFPSGTIVWSETGGVAIERIRPGDRVLSQNPESGELAYKVVVEITWRPPSPILRVVVDGTAMETTRGHLFWRVGDGWRMAKELQPGDRLHGLAGAVTVGEITEGPDSPAHNLVVEDFGTYFVGPPRLLVHDNTVRQVTAARLPGLIEQ